MMKILVVAATDLEMNAIQHLQFPKSIHLNKRVLGIGQIATTYHLMEAIHQEIPDMIIQFGIAGAFTNAFALGDTIAVESEIIADAGAVENGTFRSIFDLGLQQENEYPFDGKKLYNPHKLMLEKTSVKTATAITVNEITTSNDRIRYYISTYDPAIESMEGAAFHYTCLMKNIPFVQLRGISNYVGERNKQHWKIELALKSTAQAIQTLLSNNS